MSMQRRSCWARRGTSRWNAPRRVMAALLGSPVSSGFVARAHERFAERLQAAGFDDALSSALATEPVVCGDETPVNVARKDSDEHGTPVPGARTSLPCA